MLILKREDQVHKVFLCAKEQSYLATMIHLPSKELRDIVSDEHHYLPIPEFLETTREGCWMDKRTRLVYPVTWLNAPYQFRKHYELAEDKDKIEARIIIRRPKLESAIPYMFSRAIVRIHIFGATKKFPIPTT